MAVFESRIRSMQASTNQSEFVISCNESHILSTRNVNGLYLKSADSPSFAPKLILTA